MATGSEGRGALGGRGIVVVVVVAIAGGDTDAVMCADVIRINMSVRRLVVCRQKTGTRIRIAGPWAWLECATSYNKQLQTPSNAPFNGRGQGQGQPWTTERVMEADTRGGWQRAETPPFVESKARDAGSKCFGRMYRSEIHNAM